MVISCRSLTAVTIMLTLVLMSGCGRKTALIPPQKFVPVAISDLRYFFEESGVSLEWTFPEKMENGDKLPAIESFEVLRAEILQEDYCEGCPVQFNKQVSVEGGPLPVTGESKTAVYKETGLQDGYRYLYKVRSLAGRWYASGDSNIISFIWEPSPKGNLPVTE
jgi:hypothetical protein